MKLGNAEAKRIAAGLVMICTTRYNREASPTRKVQLICRHPFVRNRSEALIILRSSFPSLSYLRLRLAIHWTSFDLKRNGATPPNHSLHLDGCSTMSLGLTTLRRFASHPSLSIGERMSPNV